MIKIATFSAVLAVGLLAGCSNTPKAPAVASSVRKSLDQAEIKNVSVSEDRDKGVVTLGGHVETDAAKAQAAQIAQTVAGNEVVPMKWPFCLPMTRDRRKPSIKISIKASTITLMPPLFRTDTHPESAIL